MRRAWRRMHSPKDGRRPVRALSAILVLVVTLSCVSMATARTWLVEPDGSGDAPTIQAAADSSAMGDSILVQPGMYVEQVTLTDGTSLIGAAGAAATTIDGDGVVFVVTGSDIFVKGMTLIGATGTGYGFGGYGVYSKGQSEIRECTFDGSWGGVFANADVTVIDCEFRNGGAGAIYLIRGFDSGPTSASLDVRDCLFESCRGLPTILLENDGSGTGPVSVQVRGSVFRDCSGDAIVGYEVANPAAISEIALLVEDCLFDRSDCGDSGFVGPVSLGVIAARGAGLPHTADVVIRGNTFVRTDDGGLGGEAWPPLDPGTIIENNVIVGNAWGLALSVANGVTASCNLVWGNGRNWIGFPDPTGVDGNLSEPPLFCDFVTGNFAPAGNSPLLPANNSCGVQIGVFGQGCGPVSVIQTSWGRIKGLYRE